MKLDVADIKTDRITLDLTAVLGNLAMDHATMKVICNQIGADCHSAAMQPDCIALIDDITNGAADASTNTTFRVLK